jgi:hypothetical protein
MSSSSSASTSSDDSRKRIWEEEPNANNISNENDDKSCGNYGTINHLANRPPLTHTYYALRHGQSLANVLKIISSDPRISVDNHGLSNVGKVQAKAAAMPLLVITFPTTTTTTTTTTPRLRQKQRRIRTAVIKEWQYSHLTLHVHVKRRPYLPTH